MHMDRTADSTLIILALRQLAIGQITASILIIMASQCSRHLILKTSAADLYLGYILLPEMFLRIYHGSFEVMDHDIIKASKALRRRSGASSSNFEI
jgi:hypothetical protein